MYRAQCKYMEVCGSSEAACSPEVMISWLEGKNLGFRAVE